MSFEAAVWSELVHDVGSQPGAMPLFQYALTEMFDGRVGDTIETPAYRALGGVAGALRRRAE